MKKILTLINPEDRILYRIILFSFLGNKNTKETNSKERIYQLSRIKKALFSIGEIIDVPIQVLESDKSTIAFLNDPGVLLIKQGQAIHLKDGTNTIELEIRDWDLIDKYITDTNWSALDSDEVVNVYDRIASAETIK